MDLDTLFPTPKTSVWDNYVPLITNKNITTVYLTDVIEAPAMYNVLINSTPVGQLAGRTTARHAPDPRH